jgi:hypothetical protein
MPNQHHRQEEPMDATWIITAYVVNDTLMERLGHRSDVRAQVPDSAILTIAVVAARDVGRHHERAACLSSYLAHFHLSAFFVFLTLSVSPKCKKYSIPEV